MTSSNQTLQQRSVAFAMGLAIATFLATETNAQQFGSFSQSGIQHSEWSTTYTAINGSEVDARVVLEGPAGNYYPAQGGIGQLYNLRYTPIGNSLRIEGSWSLGGRQGNFNFFVAGNSNPAIFSGTWRSGQDQGDWNGSLLRTIPVAPTRPVSVGPSFPPTTQPPLPTCTTPPLVSGCHTPPIQPVAPSCQVTYGPWQFNPAKGYYLCVCTLPAGGRQYLIWYPNNPNWCYWYNPAKQVYWCASATKLHPDWGQAVLQGQPCFVMLPSKARELSDCGTPDPGFAGQNFVEGMATDTNGATVNLGTPPVGLPSDAP